MESSEEFRGLTFAELEKLERRSSRACSISLNTDKPKRCLWCFKKEEIDVMEEEAAAAEDRMKKEDEWWFTVVARRCYETVRENVKNRVARGAEAWMGDFLDKFFAQQKNVYTLDPAMPLCLRKKAQRLWDGVIPDVKLEIMHVLSNVEVRVGLVQIRRGSALAKKLDLEARQLQIENDVLYFIAARLRAFMLYKLMPWDKTIWQRMKDPWYWIFALLKGLPASQAIFFTVYLFILDKKDDYQLIEFILSSKGFQFLTSGCLTLLYYASALAYCTVVLSPGSNETKRCHFDELYQGALSSKGYTPFFGTVVFVVDLIFTLYATFANVILAWIALLALHRSVPKGVEARRGFDLMGERVLWKEIDQSANHALSKIGKRWGTHQGKVIAFNDITQEHTLLLTDTSKRTFALHKYPYIMRRPYGRLHIKKLLQWDILMCIFTSTLVLTAFIIAQPHPLHRWQIIAAITWARIIYSVTTFPFLIFRLPIIGGILAHPRPTGYTRSGKCVPKRKAYPWYTEDPADAVVNNNYNNNKEDASPSSIRIVDQEESAMV